MFQQGRIFWEGSCDSFKFGFLYNSLFICLFYDRTTLLKFRNFMTPLLHFACQKMCFLKVSFTIQGRFWGGGKKLKRGKTISQDFLQKNKKMKSRKKQSKRDSLKKKPFISFLALKFRIKSCVFLTRFLSFFISQFFYHAIFFRIRVAFHRFLPLNFEQLLFDILRIFSSICGHFRSIFRGDLT